MDTAAVLFFLSFIIALMLGSTAFFFAHLRADHAIRLENHRADLDDRDARRHVLLTRLDANREGNYPIHFREATLEFIAPPPGNRPFADNIYFQPSTGANRPDKITVMKPNTPNEIRINAYNAQRVLGEVDTEEPERLTAAPERSELSEPAYERQFEPTNGQNDTVPERSNLDIRAILWEAKRRGEGKQATIERAIGIKKGGSPTYQMWSTVWDTLE